MNESKIDVDLAILSLIERLQKDPFIIYSEKDLQALLSLELLDMDKLYNIKATVNGIQMKTNRVHREYPYVKKNIVKGNIDIVIFSEKDIENIDGEKGTKFGYLHVFKEKRFILAMNWDILRILKIYLKRIGFGET